AAKWPSSCTSTRKPSPTTATKKLTRAPAPEERARARVTERLVSCRHQSSLCDAPGLFVCRNEFFEAPRCCTVDLVERVLDRARKRGRVRSELPPHRPGRMGKRRVGRHGEAFLARAPAKRTAGRGQHERLDGVGGPALEALVDRGMLAVDRDQQPTPALVRR